MNTPTPAIVRLADFAKLHRVSKAAVTKWKARGLLVLTLDGRVDVIASNKRLADRPAVTRGRLTKGPSTSDVLAPPQPDKPGDPDAWSLAEATRRERVAAAKLRELELAEKAGAVVPIAEVAKAVSAEYAIVRTALLGMASKLAHRLAAAMTPEAAGALVDGEVRSILEALTADAIK
jgi:hypothetical protein